VEYLGIIERINNKGYIMSVTEKMMEAIEEVLDEKEKEVVLSYLDNADEIDFDNFWNTKNYEVIADKGLTTYWTKPMIMWGSATGGYENRRTLETGFRKVSRVTVYERLIIAFKKLEKSPKLRAIGYTL